MAKLNSVPHSVGMPQSVSHLVIIALCTVVLSVMRVAASPQEPTLTPRLLNSEEGLKIVNTAWEHEQQLSSKLDCSHLVHQIYQLAGFSYPYASSFDLYGGSENFTRVRTPQPGDLIIWPGHAGIVLDPVQHTFYSSVRSGLRAESYDGPYWRRRGKARFYRYTAERPGDLVMAQSESRASKTSAQLVTAPVVKEGSEVLLSASKQPNKATRGASASVVGPSAPAVTPKTFEVPASILIATREKQPTRDEVAKGISELTNGTGSVLRAHDLSRLPLRVVIFEQLDVERVEIHGDRGWAHVRIDSRVCLADDRADFKRRYEKASWELRRAESGWVAVTPLNRAYVPRDVAVPILAMQLAHLTQSDGASDKMASVLRQEELIAGLLNDLLKNR